MIELEKKTNKKMSRTVKVLLSILLLIVIAIISLIIYEVATAKNTYYINEKDLQIPIFVYHDIVATKEDIQYDYMQTDVLTFENQIDKLMKLGYRPISYEDLVNYKEGKIKIPKHSFLITFDDGYMGIYKYAFKIAKERNIPMTSFAIDDKVGEAGYYNWEQAKEMHYDGNISIYSHGLEHIEYDKVSPQELVESTNIAYEKLKNKLKDDNLLKVFTYPYGLYTEEDVIALGNEGYIQNLTDNKINRSRTLDLKRLHRCYPLDDSALKILLKIEYRTIKYRT